MIKSKKSLKNLVKLDSKVVIYVPSTYNINKKIDNENVVAETLEFLSVRFGGATSTKAVGSWVSDGMGLVNERIILCYSYTTTEKLEQYMGEVLEYCYKLKNDMKQEAISFEVNNELYIL